MAKQCKFYSLFIATLFAMGAQAQSNGSNSSYSRYGMGILNDQSQGFNKGMAGVGIGVRIGNKVNMVNPASYSSIDSLSFIFDAGMNVSIGRLKNGGTSQNVLNGNLDFVNAGFRLRKGLGVSLGFVPYTSIGYNFASPDRVITEDVNTHQQITTHNTYVGEGGLHQAYVGIGWEVWKKLSLGANISYMWGNYSHSITPSFKEGGVSTSKYSGLNKSYEAELRTYKLDLGFQYPVRLTNQDWLTIGGTVGMGHPIKSDAMLTRFTTSGDSTTITAKKPFDLPYTYGIGLSWNHQNRLTVAMDAKHERWADCRMPMEHPLTFNYEPMKGGYKNRTRIAAGAQFTPNPYNRRYWNRIQYRLGAHYSTPYLVVNGLTGPKEYGITAGFGLPISNIRDNRSMINFSMQWLQRSPSAQNMIKENYLMFNLGMTFNEQWFMKFKIN